jgi:hypothetical protein
MLAAALITLACSLAPAQPGIAPHDQCDRLVMQRWEGPTTEELDDCVNMAESLTLMGQRSTCELQRAEEEPAVALYPAPPVKGPSRALNGKTLASRNSAPAELSNRDLYNQRGTGVEPPKARFIMPNPIVPMPVKFMY